MGDDLKGSIRVLSGSEGSVNYYRIVRYLTANGLPVRKADYVRQMIRRLVELKVCDELFRDLSEIVGNNEHQYDAGVQMVCGSIPDATGHSGDAICPECGSSDPKAHYVPHDAYKACENIWHITEVRIPRRDR